MTERILRHKKPADVPFSIKRYLGDEWANIPDIWKHGINDCWDCGLSAMRLVYQEFEVYTIMCMHCGKAYRFHAHSVANAKWIYNHVNVADYWRAQHAVGLSHSDKPTGRNYFATGGHYNPFSTLPDDCYGREDNSYWLTPYGYRLLGFDDMGDGRYLKILW